MAFRNQIVGLIRFSLVTTGDFYPGFAGPEELAAFLFDEARLARRFAMFEALTLPSLAAQHDGDFQCIVLGPEALPAPWLQRLRALLEPFPWARLQLAAPAPHYRLIRAAFDAVPARGFTHRTTFRLDDDDALDRGHIARLRRLAERLWPVQEGGQDGGAPLGLGFNRGLYLDLSNPHPELFDARERTPVSAGAAIVAPAGWPGNVYHCNHRALGQFQSSWFDAENIAFLRTVHRDNKSKPHFSGSRREMDPQELPALLEREFGLRLADLQALARKVTA